MAQYNNMNYGTALRPPDHLSLALQGMFPMISIEIIMAVLHTMGMDLHNTIDRLVAMSKGGNAPFCPRLHYVPPLMWTTPLPAPPPIPPILIPVPLPVSLPPILFPPPPSPSEYLFPPPSWLASGLGCYPCDGFRFAQLD